MDQKVIAGVGNVYRAEVLFRHGIDPYRAGRDLTRAEWDTIWADLGELMREGVRNNRIDTVRPEHLPEAMGRPPRKDDHGGEVYVYRRANLPCHICRTEIRTADLVSRNLFWCPRCQPRDSPATEPPVSPDSRPRPGVVRSPRNPRPRESVSYATRNRFPARARPHFERIVTGVPLHRRRSGG